MGSITWLTTHAYAILWRKPLEPAKSVYRNSNLLADELKLA